MARLDVELDRLADPTAWPDRCARCGAHDTTLVPVPDKWAKKQVGWRLPLCPAHADDWDQVRRKNRVGMAAIVTGMAVAAGVTWAVHPRFAPNADDATRAAAAFFVGFASVIPFAVALALWAKTPIRIEKVVGRFASVIGLGRAFKAAAADALAPVPLPAVGEEARFDVSPYATVPTAAPEAVGLLFLASVLLGAAMGFGVGVGGLELHEHTKGWGRNDWRYVGLVVLMAAAAGLLLFGMRFSVTRVGLFILGTGVGLVGVVAGVLKVIGFRSEDQFGVLFTGLPLLVLGVGVLRPLVWNRRIRHPSLAAVVAALGPLAYAGVVYLVAGLADGPQRFALGVGPAMAVALALMTASAAGTPYCLECGGWLVSRRLGAVGRTRAEMEPLIAGGGLVSVSAAKTYQEKTSIYDTELTAHRCPACGDHGTVVLELFDCQWSGGKNPTPTLTRVGRWQYPGAAIPVIDALFPPERAEENAEDPTPRPPPRSGEGVFNGET